MERLTGWHELRSVGRIKGGLVEKQKLWSGLVYGFQIPETSVFA